MPERNRWMLTVRGNGKKKRTFYKTEEAAKDAWRSHCRHQARFGSASKSITPEDAREFAEAKRITPDVDLREVARFYRHHHPEGLETKTVADAFEEFMAREKVDDLSKRHREALKGHVGQFALTFGGRSVPSITGNDVLAWVNALGLAPRTLENYLGSLSNFFHWCFRRGYVKDVPTMTVAKADMPTVKPKPKGVLSVDQTAAMMDHLAAHYPRYVPWHALQLFAGIRRAEVERMDWSGIDIDARTITLLGWSADGRRLVKTGDDWRLHGLPGNLWTWLETFGGDRDGAIRVPGNDAMKRIRGKEFPGLSTPIPKWPQNAMRHTFCTMLMSLHGDAAKVANWSRHTNAAQLYRSYVGTLVSREEAERFTRVLPATRHRSGSVSRRANT